MTKTRLLVAVAAGALVAVPASAVTVVGATTLVIRNAIPTWLQVAEVQAVTFGAVNVAAAANGGVATASGPTYDAFASADKAIDGNTGGGYYTDTIYHPASSDGGQFLQVDFAAPSTLSSLTIFGRADCCHDRDTYTYAIYGATGGLLASGRLDATAGPSGTVTFDAPGGVPEASTWAMLIAGFGLTGAAMRRRTRAVAA